MEIEEQKCPEIDFPQIVLALRGSYGVAQRRGYEVFLGAVVLLVVLKHCKLPYRLDVTLKNITYSVEQ